MPKALVNGVNIYYEVTGSGFPLVWSHEFAGDYRSWEAQVRFFSRRYRVITYNARGYPPSDVPEDPAAYSQALAVEDLYQLLLHLQVEQAYIAGLSMGGAVAVSFAIAHPEMVRSLISAGTGAGATNRAEWESSMAQNAQLIEREGMRAAAETYGRGPTRLQLLRKDPRGWQEFAEQLASHSARGSALTIRGVQLKRPTIYDLESKLRQLTMPTLIVVGDEDEACVEASLFMKRCIPRSGLVTFPQSGHVINLEDPDAFNRAVLDFLTLVEAGGWA
ncbi:MAG: alpha/beta hydrolase [Bacteroidetes bacterium]|nr:alpha/beta hydrolase [Bacteroidota bacterium]MCL5027039.1 alpha/beta hydrolase [Chloroflexota bacterium]